MYNSVQPEWAGQTVYIIGGGPSLKGVDLDAYLMGVPVIAANDAYQFECADICVFGDMDWYHEHKVELAGFPGRVITTKDACHGDGILHMKEIGEGLSRRSDALAWNTHTGSLCINLAYLMGAAQIVLLGFDMHSDAEESNWHYNPRPASKSATANHVRGTQMLADRLHQYAPEVRVYLTKDSALTCWPKVDLQQALEAALIGAAPQVVAPEPLNDITVAVLPGCEELIAAIVENCTYDVGFVVVDSVYEALNELSGRVTFVYPNAKITGNMDTILAHTVPFGALYGSEKAQLDARMLQWTDPQKWVIARKRYTLRYPPSTTLQMWVESSQTPWVRLNQHHVGVFSAPDTLEIGV